MSDPAAGTRRMIKRGIDLALAALLLVVCLPLMLALALAVLLLSGPPLLYTEQRLGLHGGRFTLRKFRTLRPGTEGLSSVAPDDDPRISPVGRLLRRTRLDELPQLFSVLRGDMSLIGPRPLPPRHAESLPTATLEKLLSVPPGLSGAAAVEFLGEDAALAGHSNAEELYLTVILPRKVPLELDYVDNWRLQGDLLLMAKTLGRVFLPRARHRSRDKLRQLITDSRANHL